MLEGITILNQVEIIDSPWWGIPLGGVVAIVIGMFVMLLLGAMTDWSDIALYIGTIVAVLSMFGIWAATSNTIHTGRYEYHVTIDDTVDFKELYEHYDIIEQQGEIYIIEDKEK